MNFEKPIRKINMQIREDKCEMYHEAGNNN